MTPFRPTENPSRRFPSLGTLALALLLLSGCAMFGRRSDWYSGPAEIL